MILRQLVWMLVLLSANASYAQTRQQTENLYTFARLYGYVRYFHPSDANVLTDWDKFAIYGAQQAEKATNRQELRKILEELFNPVAPSLRIYSADSKSTFGTGYFMPADTSGMESVTWQHNGYGAGSNNQMYRSVRTNSYIKAPQSSRTTSRFSTITTSVDATNFRGRTVRYSAAIKSEDLSEGQGQLWMRVDLANNKTGFFNNMSDRPFKGVKANWRRDTITGTINADGKSIVVGCFILGKGSLLLDDVKLEVDTDTGWQPIPLNGDFETGAEGWYFDNSDQSFNVITSQEQAIQGQQSLRMERGKLNSLIKTDRLFTGSILPAGTVIWKDIGSGLAITMPVALWGDGQHTYPLTDTAETVKMNNVITSKLSDSYTADNLYIRLADVIITWNVFQHFHPYYREWLTDWDKELQTALTNCYRDKTPDDFLLTLKKFTATLRDGHTQVYRRSTTPMAYLPVIWHWIENRLVVTRVLSAGLPLQNGDEITAINGVTARKYIDSVMKTISAGSANALFEAAVGDMRIGVKDSALGLSVAGKKMQVTYSLSPNDYYKMVIDTSSGYRQLDSGQIYINISVMPWKEMQAKLPEMAKAKVLIFDLRGYPKDENGSAILSHLLKNPEKTKWMQLQQIILPDHEKTDWDSIGWNLSPKVPHIGGKVFFLTNASAISYAESVMGYVKGEKLATIIGEPTAGANGDVNTVSLPGGYFFIFTGLKATNHNGTQHFMKGIQPDVQVSQTIKGIREGRDELLEKALELSKQ